MSADIRDNVTAYRTANKIRQLREDDSDYFNKSFLIVEGDTDARFYKALLDQESCHIEIAQSKDKVIDALKILEQSNFAGALAIVDADFWVLEGSSHHTSPNLLLTDFHDLEAMLVESPALDKLLAEYTNKAKDADIRKNIREKLLEAGKIVGYLRWISLQEKLNFDFEGLAFEKFLDKRTLTIDVIEAVRIVKARSRNPKYTEQELKKLIDDLTDTSHDLWYVCNGHDLIHILSIAFDKALGLRKVNQKGDRPDTKPDNLALYLRLAYEGSYFCATKLYKAIRNWEDNNKPFKVLSMTIINLCD